MYYFKTDCVFPEYRLKKIKSNLFNCYICYRTIQASNDLFYHHNENKHGSSAVKFIFLDYIEFFFHIKYINTSMYSRFSSLAFSLLYL